MKADVDDVVYSSVFSVLHPMAFDIEVKKDLGQRTRDYTGMA